MPRVKPHAKVHVSLRNHRKTAALFGDNEMLATYVRLLLLATERFADRTGDSFMIHKSEIGWITGRGRTDVARRSLGHLADISPISVHPEGDLVRIVIPNFARKQGFRPRKGKGMEYPPSPAPSPTNITPPIDPPKPKPAPKERAKGKTPRVPFPDPIPDSLQSGITSTALEAGLDPDLLIARGRDWAISTDARYAGERGWLIVFQRAVREGWSWVPRRNGQAIGASRPSSAEIRQAKTIQAGIDAMRPRVREGEL